MATGFAKICDKPWFGNIIKEVTPTIAGKSADGPTVKSTVIYILQQVGVKMPHGDPFATKVGIVFDMVDALTGDDDLRAEAKALLAQALGQ
jgi:hypothetical protein